jgi:hypothetical protein
MTIFAMIKILPKRNKELMTVIKMVRMDIMQKIQEKLLKLKIRKVTLKKSLFTTEI